MARHEFVQHPVVTSSPYLSLTLLLFFPEVATSAPLDGPLVSALVKEQTRSFRGLKKSGPAPLYFLAYRVYDTQSWWVSASYGALDQPLSEESSRSIQVEARVGSRRLDNTHPLRSKRGGSFSYGAGAFSDYPIPITSGVDAVRAALWAATDHEVKVARQRLVEIRANKAVLSEEEDPSPDFSKPEPLVHFGAAVGLGDIDAALWEARVRRLSSVFKRSASVFTGSVRLRAAHQRRTLVTTEGTRIQDESAGARIEMWVSSTSEDGMELWLSDHVDVPHVDLLPSEEELVRRAEALTDQIQSLRVAPLADPFVGPAILGPRAAGVFFHEVFGHRVEGHRQKREDEGRTFKGRVGRSVMPEFISIVDDPTQKKLGELHLSGAYAIDDEGVRAESASLVERGVFKGFLMSRSPLAGFERSNGHGRAAPGRAPVARQGNLIVRSEKRVSPAHLRKMLVEEVVKQGKRYGLYFDRIEGGFTTTQSSGPQAFKVLPVRVFRVYADGRPDEEVRGVDIVGTPLTSLERIVATGDDDGVFNGSCGAESGWVSVSAVAPSILVATIETERRQKSQTSPPLLARPLDDGRGSKKRKTR